MLKPSSSLSLPTTLFSSTIALSPSALSLRRAVRRARYERARQRVVTAALIGSTMLSFISSFLTSHTHNPWRLSLSLCVCVRGEKVKDLLMVCVRVKCVSAWRACFFCVLCLTTSEYYCNYLIKSDNVPIIVLLLSNTFANTCMCFSITC